MACATPRAQQPGPPQGTALEGTRSPAAEGGQGRAALSRALHTPCRGPQACFDSTDLSSFTPSVV